MDTSRIGSAPEGLEVQDQIGIGMPYGDNGRPTTFPLEVIYGRSVTMGGRGA